MRNETNNEPVLTNSNENPYYSSVTCLTQGLLNVYEPSLTQVEKALKELTDKETVLLDQIHTENLCLSETQHNDDLNEMFAKIELYQSKLTNIKREMKILHDKSLKLKKRALKIQQFKEKQEYIRQQKEADIKMEQDLIGKHKTT
ncbi:biogenesis of lysosome-related organelles complex 1 subunit 6-like [Tribolium madens]|uniref:biogenesis of lysosome-related organelles complex 1 subunit 6-like n=1 Tax=Tribolium madens TaxID=41895 RepID=UPI001CF73084|nr:biogenesis of lysosome-related organelles complex 1 subunit 6-like [Tribolium madens]